MEGRYPYTNAAQARAQGQFALQPSLLWGGRRTSSRLRDSTRDITRAEAGGSPNAVLKLSAAPRSLGSSCSCAAVSALSSAHVYLQPVSGSYFQVTLRMGIGMPAGVLASLGKNGRAPPWRREELTHVRAQCRPSSVVRCWRPSTGCRRERSRGSLTAAENRSSCGRPGELGRTGHACVLLRSSSISSPCNMCTLQRLYSIVRRQAGLGLDWAASAMSRWWLVGSWWWCG